jgi:hypothetical protein
MQHRSILVLLFTGLAFGCSSSHGAARPSSSAADPAHGGGPQTTDHATPAMAAQAFAAEACAFQERCGRVGEDKQFVDGEACRTGFEETAIHGLKACEHGVDASLLVTCMEQIRGKSCSADVMSACRFAELCALR